MTLFRWEPKHDLGGSIRVDGAEFDETWNVYNYEPPVGTPAWVALIQDRPDLAPGAVHPFLTAFYVDHFDPQPIGTGTGGWEVRLRWKKYDPEEETNTPPLDRAARIATDFESEEVPTFTKADGTYWINTANDLLSGMTTHVERIIFRVRKNVNAYPAWLLTYKKAVNSDTVNIRGLTVDPHYLRLANKAIGEMASDEIEGQTYNYYPMSFDLIYDPRDWKTRALNRGLYYYPGGTASAQDKKPFLDENGEPMTEPQFLDVNGDRLPKASIPAGITLVEGWDYDLMPFADLPLT